MQKGLITQEALEKQSATDLVLTLVRKGQVKREELGLPPLTPEVIFEKDMVGVASANAVVALLDGTQVDDGTACEIGIFCALMRTDPAKKGIIGLMTDSRGMRRATRGHGINLFVLGAIEECGMVMNDFRDVIKQLQIWEAELAAKG